MAAPTEQRLRVHQYGTTRIEYTVIRMERKHLRISVHPDRSVEVRAPLAYTDEQIAETLDRRVGWVVEQLDFFLSFEPRYTLKQYVPGETHRYLGRQYRLRWITIGEEEQEGCALRGAHFEISCRSREGLEPLLKAWFAAKAELKLRAFAKTWVAFFLEVYRVEPTSLAVREIGNRWGTCTPSGRVVLNPRLIHHRRSEIEYVIVHELCHLVVPNHGRRFVDLLRRVMPDYEVRKGRLEWG